MQLTVYATELVAKHLRRYKNTGEQVELDMMYSKCSCIFYRTMLLPCIHLKKACDAQRIPYGMFLYNNFFPDYLLLDLRWCKEYVIQNKLLNLKPIYKKILYHGNSEEEVEIGSTIAKLRRLKPAQGVQVCRQMKEVIGRMKKMNSINRIKNNADFEYIVI